MTDAAPATSLGLAAVALAHGDNPLISLTAEEVGQGLPAVKAITALAGKSGATAMLILLFLAVTSAASAEQIAVSSLLTYDVYGTYVNRAPSEKQVLLVSHGCIVGYALFMGAIATAFNYIGISMGYLYELMGTMIGSAVVPIAACICWRRANGAGAVAGALTGFAAGVAGWLGITAALNDGVINVETTFGDFPMLAGNLLSIGVGGVVTVAWSLLRPVDFDWEITRAINAKAGAEAKLGSESSIAVPAPEVEKDDKGDDKVATVAVEESECGTLEANGDADAEETRDLTRAFRFAAATAGFLTLALIFVIPLPQFFSSYIYPRAGFTAWVAIVIAWLFGGLFMIGIYPLYEARGTLAKIARGIWRDIRGRGE